MAPAIITKPPSMARTMAPGLTPMAPGRSTAPRGPSAAPGPRANRGEGVPIRAARTCAVCRVACVGEGAVVAPPAPRIRAAKAGVAAGVAAPSALAAPLPAPPRRAKPSIKAAAAASGVPVAAMTPRGARVAAQEAPVVAWDGSPLACEPLVVPTRFARPAPLRVAPSLRAYLEG